MIKIGEEAFGGFAGEIAAAANKLQQEVLERREEILKAWMAKTGMAPDQAALIEQRDGFIVRCWVELQPDRCVSHRAENQMLKQRVKELEGTLKTLSQFILAADVGGGMRSKLIEMGFM